MDSPSKISIGSCDVTMPLSWMVCYPWAGTTLCLKKTMFTDVALYNFNSHQPILVIFDRNVPALSCGVICVILMFSRFDTIPECDRHTHTQTDRQTHDDGIYRA